MNATASGTLTTGLADAQTNVGTSALSGTITVRAGTGSVSIADATTGDALSGTTTATSGGITLNVTSAGLNATSSGSLTTGAADASAGTNATSGTITVRSGTTDVVSNGVVNVAGTMITGTPTQGSGSATYGDISVFAAAGDLTINNQVNAGDAQVSLAAQNGSIVQGASGLITANVAVLEAGTNIGVLATPLQTDLKTIAAKATTGEFAINEVDTTTADGLVVSAVPLQSKATLHMVGGIQANTSVAITTPGVLTLGTISGVGGVGTPTGSVTITANSLVDGTISALTGTLTSALPVEYQPTSDNVIIVNFNSLTLQGTTTWHFETGSQVTPPNPLVAPPNASVCVFGIPCWTFTAAQSAAGQASSAAQAAAAAAAADEASNTFGTDSVAEQIEFGFAGDVGVLPPMDHRLQGVGISVPFCFNESREGEECAP